MATLEGIMELLKANSESMDTGFSDIKKDMTELKTDMATFKEDIKKTVEATNDRINSLEIQLQAKEEEISVLRKDFDAFTRKNNVVFFNVEEHENSVAELRTNIICLIKRITNASFQENDINDIYRLGKKTTTRRPIVISFVHLSNAKLVLTNKRQFKEENISVAQDFSKSVSDERKRLQPMVTALNQNGRKAVLRLDELFVDGTKWTREMVEKEFQNFEVTSKRQRSPENHESEGLEPRPRLRLELNVEKTPKSTKNGNKTPETPFFSPKKNMYPLFQQNRTNTVLSPIPGGSKNSKAFEVRYDK